MQQTLGLLDTIKHHHQVPIMVNENCAIPLPEAALHKLLQPHKLSYYYFVFVDQGTETVQLDSQDMTISDGQVIFALPNQVFAHSFHHPGDHQYKMGFDQTTLSMLPQAFPFLINPLNVNVITFDSDAKQRVKAGLSFLFQLLHSPGKPKKVDIILAHLNTLLTEFNSAYFEHSHQDVPSTGKLSKYVAFKLAVETHLTQQHDVYSIAQELAMTPSSLYGLVKQFSGLSPKEWITNRLMQEAQRKLYYSSVSVKELAYDLGFDDPDYFSRLFKKNTGKSVSAFLNELRELSSN